MAPVCDLEEAVRFVTTGFRRENGGLAPFATRGFFATRQRPLRRRLAPEPGIDRDSVLELLRTLPDYGDSPLERLRGARARRASDVGRTRDARAVRRIAIRSGSTSSSRPSPTEARESLAALSAVRGAGNVAGSRSSSSWAARTSTSRSPTPSPSRPPAPGAVHDPRLPRARRPATSPSARCATSRA